MELKEFIKKTLIEIATGIEEAKKELGEDRKFKTTINPAVSSGTLVHEGEGYKKLQEIEFDIVVIVEQKKEGKAGIGVLTSIISAGASKSTGDSNSETHHIRFKVPIKFA